MNIAAMCTFLVYSILDCITFFLRWCVNTNIAYTLQQQNMHSCGKSMNYRSACELYANAWRCCGNRKSDFCHYAADSAIRVELSIYQRVICGEWAAIFNCIYYNKSDSAWVFFIKIQHELEKKIEFFIKFLFLRFIEKLTVNSVEDFSFGTFCCRNVWKMTFYTMTFKRGPLY